MNPEPLVSVITIFLNGDRFIAEAIESVLAQTYLRWELLLVDDGSTDRASAIAQGFAARFPEQIRYFEHTGHANRGMSASRNLGIQHARGDYVSYLDADDVWRPEKLADQVALLAAHPEAAYVYGPLELWRSWTGRPADKDELQDLGIAADRIVLPPELLILFLRNDRNIPSGIMIRTEDLKRAGAYDETFTGMYEDLVVHAKICLSHPVYASCKSWYRYRQHPDSCNAQAWRTGQDRETEITFLRWLEGYLVQAGAAEGEVWETLKTQLRSVQPSAIRRLPRVLRHQAGRAKRLTKRTIKKARRALAQPPVILCYHRVLEPDADPHLLAVSAEHFRQQLEVVQRIARPLSLGELNDALSHESLPPRGVVVTFDDGYLDNLEGALPILRELRVPATIYIATGYVGKDREFWWDDLERLTLGANGLPGILDLQINGRQREWDLGAAAGDSTQNGSWNVLASGEWTPRQKLFTDLHATLRPLAEASQQDVLEQLRVLTGTPPAARPLYRCVNASELKTLATEPLITLGAHTITHCDLDYRTPVEQEAEINGSRLQLEKIIDCPVDHFSYPYGSFNDDAVAVCARNKFHSAVSCIEEPVVRSAPVYRLPRFFVRNWDGSEFEKQLQRFFRG